MNLRVDRQKLLPNCTLGELLIDNKHQCFCLEDAVREIDNVPVVDWKIPGRTAIPVGTYKVVIDMSARFKRRMPHLLDVPGFEGVRIHSGNTAKDTEGCLLVGESIQGEALVQSRVAFDELFNKIDDALGRGEEVWVTVGKL